MTKKRVFKPLGNPVDEANIKTLNRPLKGFPNRSVTVQSILKDGNLDSSVNISNLTPMTQCEAGFRIIELLCSHLIKSLNPTIANIDDPAYRLLQEGIGKYVRIKEQAEAAIRSLTNQV